MEIKPGAKAPGFLLRQFLYDYYRYNRRERRRQMTLGEILEQAKTLSRPERKALIKQLIDLMDEPEGKQHSILELAGMGAEIWEGIDAQEYVNQLRDEWDERP
jgi:hypothetical protein